MSKPSHLEDALASLGTQLTGGELARLGAPYTPRYDFQGVSDVAQAFERALSRPAAIGASFHVVAEQAMTLRGLAAGVAQWFGREPVLDFVDWPEFERRTDPAHAGATREHTFRSITASIARAREVLGYAPRYSTLEALHEALAWLVAHGEVDAGAQPFPAESGA